MDTLYHDQQVNTFVRLLIIAVILSLICTGVYYIVNAYFRYEGFDERVENLQQLIKLRKKQVKGKSDFVDHDLQNVKTKCSELLNGPEHMKLHHIMVRVENIGEDEKHEEKLECLIDIDKEL